jgi:hypothetical protein
MSNALAAEDKVKIGQKLKYWADQLRDLSGRNRLLFWKDTRASSAVITEPELFDVFERVVVKGKKIIAPLPLEEEQEDFFENIDGENADISVKEKHSLGPNEFSSDKTPKVLNNALRNLRYKSRTIQEEQGFNALFLAFGMLKWREGLDGEFNEAPLVMVPLSIDRENMSSPFELSMFEEDIVANPTLQSYLKNSFSLDFPDIPTDLSTQGLEEYFSQVSYAIQKIEGWEVLNKVVLGIFNFQTLMIIKDLEKNAEKYKANHLIQMLSGILFDMQGDFESVPRADELDDKVDMVSVFQVLDADSSQQEAIEAAKRGVSFVLQGPPGTGKSQTIANIIAESLAADKTVLFVSQKAAALEVVKARLDKCGLGEFCLEVHSHKKNKKDVIQELDRSLVDQTRISLEDSTHKRKDLQKVRNELNQFVRALHKPKFKLGLSLYRIQGELAKRFDSIALNFSMKNLESLTIEQHQKQQSLVRVLSTYDNLIQKYESHPWKGVKTQSITLQEREEIALQFQKEAEAISEFMEKMNSVARKYNLNELTILRQGSNLLRVISVYDANIFTEEYRDVVDRYDRDYKSNFRYISPRYWGDSRALASIHRKQTRLDPNKASQYLKLAREIRENSIDSGLIPIYGPNLSEQSINEFYRLYNLMQELDKFSRTLYNDNQLPSILDRILDLPSTSVSDWFRNQANKIDDIVEWVNFSNIRIEAYAHGLDDFVIQALDTQLHPDSWETSFQRRFYLLLTDLIVQSDNSLKQFRSSSHTNLVERFKKLDQEIIDTSKQEIKSKLQLARPSTLWVQADSAETSILKREVNKKRRIKPLRILFKEIPNLLLTLRPCLMMSPLTVSQLLDPDVFHFDLAIFDEASQIPPEYSVGTFMRTDQVIIAGDRHQLPPTRFFQSLETDDYSDEDYDVDEYESILHACDSISIPNKMLLWHYRSQDESLITFSNYQFYDNRLLTFPNADSSRKTTGLEFVYVPDGIYKRGHGARFNHIEARRVAELVVENVRNFPERTIGVVTFSQSQRQVIEDEVDRLKRMYPDLYPLFSYEMDEPFFVKNLENVQGDERDVIIFSIGYGKDETGNFIMNFGPLNRQGGERRLNVAITRARVAVKLVASFEPEDIDLSRTESRGAHLLRNYMKTARDGVSAIYEDSYYNPDADFDSPFEMAVYDELTKHDIQLVKQVGVSKYRIDFGVVDPEKPGRFLLGIECDGAMYHSTPTARERDRLRQQLLEEKYNWRIHRIWSRDWINNPQAEIQKVLHAIDESKRKGPKQTIVNKSMNSPSEESVEGNPGLDYTVSGSNTVDKPIPPNAQIYRKGNLRKTYVGGAKGFHDIPIHNIAYRFVTIVESEGPIHRDVAKKRVAQAFGVRQGKKVDEKLEWSISIAKQSGKIEVKNPFLWPLGLTDVPLRVHHEGRPERKIDEIPPQEIDAGIVECVKNSLSIEKDDLIKETAKLFGLKSTKAVSRIIGNRITQLLRTKRLTVSAKKIMLVKT